MKCTGNGDTIRRGSFPAGSDSIARCGSPFHIDLGDTFARLRTQNICLINKRGGDNARCGKFIMFFNFLLLLGENRDRMRHRLGVIRFLSLSWRMYAKNYRWLTGTGVMFAATYMHRSHEKYVYLELQGIWYEEIIFLGPMRCIAAGPAQAEKTSAQKIKINRVQKCRLVIRISSLCSCRSLFHSSCFALPPPPLSRSRFPFLTLIAVVVFNFSLHFLMYQSYYCWTALTVTKEKFIKRNMN